MGKKYFMWVFGILITGCNSLSAGKRIRALLPGTYVNESASSYSRVFDTLRIAKEGDDGNLFSVERSVSFNRLIQGKLCSKEYHLEHWTGIYDEGTNLLTDTKKGRVYVYVPEKKKLFLGNTVYLKLK